METGGPQNMLVTKSSEFIEVCLIERFYLKNELGTGEVATKPD